MPALDPDLQELWDASPVIEHRTRVLQIQEDRKRNRALTAGIEGQMMVLGSNKDALIESLYLLLAPNYMKPSSTSNTQDDASMSADASADAKRLGKAAYYVWQEIKGAKDSWQ